jgi:hypothetical protein
MSERRS